MAYPASGSNNRNIYAQTAAINGGVKITRFENRNRNKQKPPLHMCIRTYICVKRTWDLICTIMAADRPEAKRGYFRCRKQPPRTYCEALQERVLHPRFRFRSWKMHKLDVWLYGDCNMYMCVCVCASTWNFPMRFHIILREFLKSYCMACSDIAQC